MDCEQEPIKQSEISIAKPGHPNKQSYKCPYCKKLHWEKTTPGQGVKTPYGPGIVVHGQLGRYLVRLSKGQTQYFYAKELN